MRKISLLLVLCMLLACLAACNDGNEDTLGTEGSTDAVQTTDSPDVTVESNTTEEPDETDEPETPQSNWTQRY